MFTAILVVATDVGGCEWFISARAVCMDVAFWKFSNNPRNSTSVADAMTFIVILYSKFTGPFYWGFSFIVVLDFGPSKKYPPALLRDSGSEMWDASEYMWIIISLILYYFTASGCDAL